MFELIIYNWPRDHQSSDEFNEMCRIFNQVESDKVPMKKSISMKHIAYYIEFNNESEMNDFKLKYDIKT